MYDDVSLELFGRTIKPVQAAPQRWTGVVKPTRRLLETWPAVTSSIVGHRDKMQEKYGDANKNTISAQEKVNAFNRLRRNRQPLMEHLALLEGTHEVIADAQYIDAPGGAHSHMAMIEHRVTTFNENKPLPVVHFDEKGK